MAARSSCQLPLTRHITRDCDGLLGGYQEDRSGECALKRHSLPMREFPLYAARSGRYRLSVASGVAYSVVTKLASFDLESRDTSSHRTDIDHLSESGCDLSASVLRCLSRVRWGVGSFSCPLSAFFGPRLDIRRLISSLRGAMRPVTHVTAASTIFCRLSPHLGRLRQISRLLQKVVCAVRYRHQICVVNSRMLAVSGVESRVLPALWRILRLSALSHEDVARFDRRRVQCISGVTCLRSTNVEVREVCDSPLSAMLAYAVLLALANTIADYCQTTQETFIPSVSARLRLPYRRTFASVLAPARHEPPYRRMLW
ncbi:hypothetical protein EDB86DRAFT_3136900 [Lactarius hatsudake]|nr:hypothetical protein EDB86DRAFT_3136900 [Lactarius hatsudake]